MSISRKSPRRRAAHRSSRDLSSRIRPLSADIAPSEFFRAHMRRRLLELQRGPRVTRAA